jgi:hypothetical protein
MIRLGIILAVSAVIAGGGYRTTEKTVPVEASSGPAESAVPAEIQAVAETALGSGAVVLAFGDLAHNRRLQAVAVTRVGEDREQGTTWPAAAVPVTRAVVFEQEGGRWMEVLRCDEYLKNPKGFLEGAPHTPVTGWELRMDREDRPQQDDEDAVRDFYFTPIQSGKPANQETVAVRWNPKAGRYQSRGKNGEFLGEIVSLEIPGSELR